MKALLLAALAAVPGWAVPRVVPRTILAVYDGRYRKDVRDTRIHRLLEMPLNHLGLVVEYRDLGSGLPAVEEMKGIRGVVFWSDAETLAKPLEFLVWAEKVIDSGRRVVIIGDLGFGQDAPGETKIAGETDRFLAKLGIRTDNWVPVTYDLQVLYKDPKVMDFERPLPAVFPAFDRVKPIGRGMRSHLVIGRANDPDTASHLVITGPNGGFIARGYTHFASYRQDQLQWYVNPFEFLRLAFGTDDLPKLDTTTVSGRRIYYSQIDGDGWRNLTEVPAYRAKLSAAEVVLKEAIEPFPDLPVTVGPIAGDLDPEWFGTRESLRLARRMLALRWVEAGSHTYSHPLDWESLARPGAGKEAGSFLPAWLDPTRWVFVARIADTWAKPEAEEATHALRRGHFKLRSYDLYPFNLDQEIDGSIRFINRLLPRGKRVEILQWSGSTMEPEAALRAVRAAGVRNINGGDTRFDPEFASYSWVAPLGRQVGSFRQVYSSESNENTYTNLWNERYFGYRYLVETLRNTDSPVRIKPFDLYYHMYSGQKLPSLRALLQNLAFARSQSLAPVRASQYAAIVDGFFSARILRISRDRWRIDDRDGLNTVRFDRADGDTVDLGNSVGVIGYRPFQGSLYVALDAAEKAPVVALLRGQTTAAPARPYLVQSRWLIFGFRAAGGSFSFQAGGFGAGEMEWRVSPAARYEIRIERGAGPVASTEAVSNREGLLRFALGAGAGDPVRVEVRRTGGGL